MIIAVTDHCGASRIESYLEVIRQVAVRRLSADYEPGLGDIRAMDDVIAGCGLLENRTSFHVRSQGVEHMPVSSVIAGGEFVAAIPDDANCAWHRSSGHPGEHGSCSLRTIAYANSWTPGIALIS